MGERQNQPFQLSFNGSLKVDFQGSRVTSNGGLILVRDPARRKAESQAGGLVQELSLSGSQLENGAKSGGQGGVPLWGTVPPSRLHRNKPDVAEPGDGTILQ